MPVLLILALSACEDSSTGPGERGCTFFDCMYSDPDAWRIPPLTGDPGYVPKLAVTPPALADGIVGVVYETQTLTATGSDGTYVWWVRSGTLPPA